MSTAEHNTGLAKLQQELDKFNEDRQREQKAGAEGGKKKKIERRLTVTVGQTNFRRRGGEEWPPAADFRVFHKCGGNSQGGFPDLMGYNFGGLPTSNNKQGLLGLIVDASQQDPGLKKNKARGLTREMLKTRVVGRFKFFNRD